MSHQIRLGPGDLYEMDAAAAERHHGDRSCPQCHEAECPGAVEGQAHKCDRICGLCGMFFSRRRTRHEHIGSEPEDLPICEACYRRCASECVEGDAVEEEVAA